MSRRHVLFQEEDKDHHIGAVLRSVMGADL
jgi:hypothetical protein